MKEQELNFDGVETGTAKDFRGARLPRLFDVRDPGPSVAALGRWLEAGAAAHRLRHERAGTRGGRQAQKIRAHRRRCDRQVPSARRLGLLRGHGAHGAGFCLSVPDRRRAGQLGFDRRSEILRRHALHRIAADALCGPAAARAGCGHGGLGAELRRLARRTHHAAGARAESLAQRRLGHRGGHGDRHSAA